MTKPEISQLFPASYEASRERFREDLSLVKARWPSATLDQYMIDVEDDLSIDWVQADATVDRKKLFILTSGQHGAEGYAGSAMMQLFVEEFLPQLDPDDTGLLFVHAINPWGMKHMRRVNSNNVDLNRNFVWDEADLNPAANPNYILLNRLLNPQKPLGSYFLANLSFFFQLIRLLISPGQSTLRAGMLMGQYRSPQGVYYGGAEIQSETSVLMDLYRESIRHYDQIVHLDMHTGYGPCYQMSLVNSPMEHRSTQALRQAFSYPQVVSATPDEFYTMQGDMVDWVYRLHRADFPSKRLYSTSFEFGTLGDSLTASIRSMRAIVFENQAHLFGTLDPIIDQRVKAEFQALFSPQEVDWREKAVADARQAFDGILRGEGFIHGIS